MQQIQNSIARLNNGDGVLILSDMSGWLILSRMSSLIFPSFIS
ncbi:hypothetical protein [Candidatus Hadarchaeum sp.]